MSSTLEETQQLVNWQNCWSIARAHRHWLLLIPTAVWAIFCTFAWMIPAKYRSETVILVEQQKVPEHYVISNVAADLQDRLQSMTQQILSRTRLLGIIETLHLYPNQRKGATPEDLVERMREDIKIDLVKAPVRPEELTAFKIYFSCNDSRLAQQVTSQLTTLFIDENLRARQQESESTTGFLANQLEDARKDLSAQEQRIRDFKARHLGELPGQMQSNLQILSGTQSRLEAETEALDHVKQQNTYLQSLLTQYRSLRTEMEAGKSGELELPATLDQELGRLRTQLADLASHYTSRHPDVKHLQQQIAETEKLKAKIDAEMKAAGARSDADTANDAPTVAPTNPQDLKAMSPMMEIESQLKANRLEMQNRKNEIERLKSAIAQYQSQLNQTPLREQQLADLTRDYEQSRTNYESLLAKKNQSELATNLERRQQGEQFRILDPPNLPIKPYSPNRFAMSIFGLVVGLILGVTVTAILENLGGQIRGINALKALRPGIRILEIPSLLTPLETQRKHWQGRLECAGATALVLIVGLVNMAIYYHY